MNPILEKQQLLIDAVEALKHIADNTNELCILLENLVETMQEAYPTQRYDIPPKVNC